MGNATRKKVKRRRKKHVVSNDIRDVSALILYELRKRRGFNQVAMTVSGSRLDELNTIKIPVMVVHGTADAVLNIAHCQ